MTSTTLTKSEQSRLAGVSAMASEQVARLGLPVTDSKVRSEVYGAIGKATKDTVLSVLAEQGPRVYKDPSQATEVAEVAQEVARTARGAADGMHQIGIRLFRAARKADPKVPISKIGYAVEGIPESEQNRTSKVGAATRQRWSRYAKATDVVEASRDAVNAGKRDGMVGDLAALKAVSKSGADAAAIADVVRDGGDLPAGGEVVTDADGVASGRVYGGSDVVRATVRLSDVLKGADFSKMTADQWSEVDRVLATIRENLTAGRKATPAA